MIRIKVKETNLPCHCSPFCTLIDFDLLSHLALPCQGKIIPNFIVKIQTYAEVNYGIFRWDSRNQPQGANKKSNPRETLLGSVGQCPFTLFDHAHPEGLLGEATMVLLGHSKYSRDPLSS